MVTRGRQKTATGKPSSAGNTQSGAAGSVRGSGGRTNAPLIDYDDPVVMRRLTPIRVLVAPAPPPLTITEMQWMRLLIDLALWWGWRPWHDEDSRLNLPGLPDLILVRPPRIIFAELKVGRGRLNLDQQRWARDLLRCGGNVEYYLWRPPDWVEVLQKLAPETHDVVESGCYTIPRVPVAAPAQAPPPRTARSGPKQRRPAKRSA